MPAFVRIGRIDTNKSGVGSRGWTIRRAGTVVHVAYGSVVVKRSGNSSAFYWGAGWPQNVPYPKRTVVAAKQFIDAKVRSKTGTSANGHYQKLPAGKRIRAR